LEVRGKSICVSCLDFSYTCINKNFAQHWYAYQVKTTEAPGFPLRIGYNGLEVDPWVDQESLSKIATRGFMAPELDPNAGNSAQAEGREGNDN
jgi:hypothetical protein